MSGIRSKSIEKEDKVGLIANKKKVSNLTYRQF